ncbi:MAG: hypothetical protein GXX79_01910, partial [Actinomycetales bacterium]|nr:hypothetical protein [Actinomycetales bacterium]
MRARSTGRRWVAVGSTVVGTVALALSGWGPTAATSRGPSGHDVAGTRARTSPVTVVDPRCEPDVGSAQAAAGPDGRVHGFAAYVRGTCTDERMWYFEGRGSRWTQARSPYRGEVLAVADDGTGTWVLYLDTPSYDRVVLGRRLGRGRWARPQVLSRLVGSALGSGVQGADLVASHGRWWAVWAQGLPEPYASASSTMLFQAKTLGGVRRAHRITGAAAGQDEARPALALITGP